MDKNGKPPKKPQPKQPAMAPGAPTWPGQDSSGGAKRANVVHDRKPAGRGASRGR